MKVYSDNDNYDDTDNYDDDNDSDDDDDDDDDDDVDGRWEVCRQAHLSTSVTEKRP